jgi:glycosyltransferase involved in cell wall biosynthesis
MNNSPALSIVMPVYNESRFIKQNIESLLSNINTDFEIICVDNCSNDSTVLILKSFSDSRLKLILQTEPVSPKQNHIDGINSAKGQHIFIAGGDDLFRERILDQVIPILKKETFLFCGMELIDASEKHLIIGMQNSFKVIDEIFGSVDFLSNYMRYINHDTIMHSFIPRKFFINVDVYSAHSLERFWPWICIHIFGKNKRHHKRDYFHSTVLLKRQYTNPSQIRGSDYNADTARLFISQSLVIKSIGSIYNSFRYFWQYKDIVHLCILLLSSRSMSRDEVSSGGFYGLGKLGARYWTLGPLPAFILSPILDMSKIILVLIRKFK